MNHLIIRDVAQDLGKITEMFFHSLIFSMMVTIFLIIVLIVTAFFGNYSETVSKGLILVACAAPATAAILCIQSCLIGAGRIVPIGTIQTSEAILRTGIGILLIIFSVDILLVFSIFVVTRWFITIPYWKTLAPFLRLEEKGFHILFFKNFLKQVPIFSGLLLSYLIIRFSAQVMLTWMAGDKEAGYFAAGSLFLDLILLIPTALTVNLMPILAVTAKKSLKGLKTKCYQATKLITFILLPALIFVTIKAAEIINLLFGTEYGPAVPVLRLAIWIGFIFSLDQIFSTAMIVLNKQRLDLISLSISAVLTVVSMLVFIPDHGAQGAAIGFFLSILILFLLRSFIFSRFISSLNLVFPIWRYLLAAMITMFINNLLQLNLVQTALFVPTAYLGLVALTGGFSNAERKRLLAILKA